MIAFIFADLIILPIVNAYRKYYGARFAALLVGVMFGAMVIAALVVDGLFSLLGLVPTHRPSIASIVERPVTWNYTSVLDMLFACVFVALIGADAAARREGSRLRHDRRPSRGRPTSVHDGRTYYFCGAHCKHTFDANPEAYT